MCFSNNRELRFSFFSKNVELSEIDFRIFYIYYNEDNKRGNWNEEY